MNEPKTSSLKRAVTSPAGQAFIVALLVFWLLLFPAWVLGTAWISDRFIADEKNAGQQYMILLRNNAADAVYQDYAVLLRLWETVQKDPASFDSPDDFQAYARGIALRPEVRSIAIKHKGDPKIDYSPSGRDPAAVPNRTVTIMSLIYVDGTYWGYATADLDLSVLLNHSTPASAGSGYDLAVADHTGAILFGNSRVLSGNPVSQALIISPVQSLNLAMVPAGGWARSAETKIVPLRDLGFAIIVLVALLLGLITYRQVALHNQVRERTVALQESNDRLRQEIRDRARAVQALAASEKKYFALFNSANDAVVLCARAKNPLRYPLIEVNDGACMILGYSREDLLSRNLFDNAQPGCRPRVPGIFDEIERNRCATFEMEYATSAGRIVSLEMNAHLFTLEGNTLLMIVARDVSARKKIENDLRQSVAEKEMLLREVHHRVKNNLQVISSMIDLQAGSLTDAATREHFRECQDRIRSIALVHENLYQSKNFSAITADEYIQKLVDRLVRSCSVVPGIAVQYDMDAIEMDLDTAIPCGLVINELVTNALKHAFTGRDRGTIRIRLRQEQGDLLTLAVEDDGRGFPESVDLRDTESFGLQIVMALASQLDADVAIRTENGTEITLRFPKTRQRPEV